MRFRFVLFAAAGRHRLARGLWFRASMKPNDEMFNEHYFLVLSLGERTRGLHCLFANRLRRGGTRLFFLAFFSRGMSAALESGSFMPWLARTRQHIPYTNALS
jgi:hypothetical protein